MHHKIASLIVAGVIFTIIALVHILRLVYHWTVVIDGIIIPESLSIIAIVISGILAIWMFGSASTGKK